MKIDPFDSTGKPNGCLVPIWNVNERPELRPDQVYLTVIAPRCRKGPHLHKVRRGCFAVLNGAVVVWIRRIDGTYYQADGGDLIIVHPGEACALYNFGDEPLFVLNMPSPAWSKDNPDDWPVYDWQDFPYWPPK
jgi:mannose-6-phosphate isomerase-like protein (cupin superfamily)